MELEHKAIVGITTCLIVIGTAVAHGVGRRLSVMHRRFIFAAVLLLLFFPLNQNALIILIRGVTGDFSVGSVLLCGALLFSLLFKRKTDLEQTRYWSLDKKMDVDLRMMMRLVVGMSLVLYPLALGIGPIDTYHWGYGSLSFAVGLLAMCCWAWWRRYYLVVLWLLAAVLAYELRLYESNNLWDYLIDPFLMIYAVFNLIREKRQSKRSLVSS